MEFAQLASADAVYAEMLEELHAVVTEELGAAEAQRILGITKSTYSVAMSGRPKKNRQPQLRWLTRLLVKLSPAGQLRVLQPIARFLRLAITVEPRLTPEQRNIELERALLSFGDEGKRKLDQVPR